MSCYHPFAPRDVQPQGIVQVDNFRLKSYTINFNDKPLALEEFDDGLELAAAIMPRPARAEGRPGVGFIIGHRGQGVDYVVVGWWDRENELPVRVFVRKSGGSWRAAAPSESFCVWDLEIIWHEREAYIQTLLAGYDDLEAACEQYLDATFDA